MQKIPAVAVVVIFRSSSRRPVVLSRFVVGWLNVCFFFANTASDRDDGEITAAACLPACLLLCKRICYIFYVSFDCPLFISLPDATTSAHRKLSHF